MLPKVSAALAKFISPIIPARDDGGSYAPAPPSESSAHPEEVLDEASGIPGLPASGSKKSKKKGSPSKEGGFFHRLMAILAYRRASKSQQATSRVTKGSVIDQNAA